MNYDPQKYYIHIGRGPNKANKYYFIIAREA